METQLNKQDVPCSRVISAFSCFRKPIKNATPAGSNSETLRNEENEGSSPGPSSLHDLHHGRLPLPPAGALRHHPCVHCGAGDHRAADGRRQQGTLVSAEEGPWRRRWELGSSDMDGSHHRKFHETRPKPMAHNYLQESSRNHESARFH